ncbi:MAG: asparaginase [Candidatus Limnocylindrales bacterium]
MSRVAVVFTGGTIASLPDPVTGAAVPRLEGADILARTLGLGDIADVEPIDWGLVAASHLRFAQILDLAAVLRDALARPEVDGVVLVQGTDSIEETAFAFDLVVESDKPVCVVGAMRNAGDPKWDGPRNLSDAVRVAASPDARRLGTMVVMAGSILPGDDVVKTHASRETTFQAPNAGPIGAVRDGVVKITRRPPRRRAIRPMPMTAAEPVLLITATVGLDGALVRAARTLDPAGFVIAASGAGNTHPDLLAACAEAMADDVPVALTTRCVSGETAPAYGFPGGGATWVGAGAMLCGTLGGPKARIALALAIGAGYDRVALAALLAGRAQ